MCVCVWGGGGILPALRVATSPSGRRVVDNTCHIQRADFLVSMI